MPNPIGSPIKKEPTPVGEQSQAQNQRDRSTRELRRTTIGEFVEARSENGPPPSSSDRSKGEFYKRPEWWIVIINGLILFAVVYFACVNSAMYHQMIKSTDATKRSADASVASVRAWIVLTTTEWQAMQVNDIPADQKIPIPIIHFKNVGKTAAVNVVGYIEYRITIGAPNSQPHFSGCPTRVMRKDPVIIGEGDSEIWALTDSFSATDRTLIDDGKATPYLFGCIMYHDLLDPERLRVTKFTGFLQPNRLVAGKVAAEANWQVTTTKTK